MQDLLAAQDVRVGHDDLAVEAAGPQQRRIEHVGAVGRGDQDHALVGLEAVHLDQQLVQGLLALVVAAAQAGAAVAADRVDLVDEDDAGRVLLALLEHVADPAGADAHEHLDEVGAGDGEEGHVGLAGDGAGQEGLTGARRADQQHALGNLAAQALELLRIAQELDDLLQLQLGLVDAGDVVEGDPAGLFGQQPGPALAEAHGLAAKSTRRSSGFGMLGLGHAPAAIEEVLAVPMAMANVMPPSLSHLRFARRLRQEIRRTRERCPFDRFVCLNSGSEAMSLAARIADLNAGRATDGPGLRADHEVRQLALRGSFHGRTSRPARVSDLTRPIDQRHLASSRHDHELVVVEPNDWRAGIAGLIASAAFITTGVLNSTGTAVEGPATAADVGRYLDAVNATMVPLVLAGLAGLTLCVFYIVMSRGVTAHLGGDRRAAVGTRITVWGLVALVPAYVLHLAVTGGFTIMDAHGDVSDARLLQLHDAAQLGITVSFAVGSLLSLGLGPLLWGLSGRANGKIPASLGRLLIAVGCTGIVWAAPVETPVVFMLIMVNVLASLVAFIALSRALLKAPQS